MRILLTRKWPDSVEQAFIESFDVTVSAGDNPLSAAEFVAATQHFDIICPTVSDRLPAAMFEQPALRTRLLGNYGAGYEHIDVGRCRERGIVVTNTPDILTEATAELAILLILMVARRAGEGERELRNGAWQGWRPMHMHGRRVAGATLGLVGFGRIARSTAAKAAALGMTVIYHSRKPKPGGLRYCETLDELLHLSDFVSLHCPGGAETDYLINTRTLALMKPTSVLINTARGSLIDELALATALTHRKIAGAGLDVFRNEPQISQLLLEAPNLVMLPHLGSAVDETREAMGFRVLDNVRAFVRGEEPRDRVA